MTALINVIAGVVGLAIILGIVAARYNSAKNPFEAGDALLEKDAKKPPLWLYYDESEVNSRRWLDFGARSGRALNLPFLDLCYKTIVQHNYPHYRVEVLLGLTGVAEKLGGWHALPPALQTQPPLASVNSAELNWIRAAILAKYGGLWVSPYSICLAPFPAYEWLGADPAPAATAAALGTPVFYGTDLDETYSGPAGTPAPGMRTVWSPRPAHPMFVEWEQRARSILTHIRGGQQIRRDENWIWVELSAKYTSIIDVDRELARKADGRRIQLEDLLAAGQEGRIPFDVPASAVYVVIPWPELRDREMFGWFLRMSDAQIMESDLVVRDLFRMALAPFGSA